MSDAVSQAAKDARESQPEKPIIKIGPLIEVQGIVLKKDGQEVAYGVESDRLLELKQEMEQSPNKDPKSNLALYPKTLHVLKDNYMTEKDRYFLVTEVVITSATDTSRTNAALAKLTNDEYNLVEKHFKKKRDTEKKTVK